MWALTFWAVLPTTQASSINKINYSARNWKPNSTARHAIKSFRRATRSTITWQRTTRTICACLCAICAEIRLKRAKTCRDTLLCTTTASTRRARTAAWRSRLHFIWNGIRWRVIATYVRLNATIVIWRLRARTNSNSTRRNTSIIRCTSAPSAARASIGKSTSKTTRSPNTPSSIRSRASTALKDSCTLRTCIDISELDIWAWFWTAQAWVNFKNF